MRLLALAVLGVGIGAAARCLKEAFELGDWLTGNTPAAEQRRIAEMFPGVTFYPTDGTN